MDKLLEEIRQLEIAAKNQIEAAEKRRDQAIKDAIEKTQKLEQAEEARIEREMKKAISSKEEELNREKSNLNKITNKKAEELIRKSDKNTKKAISFIVKRFEEGLA